AAVFEIARAGGMEQLARAGVQGAARRLVDSDRPAADREGVRDQRVAEKQAANLGQRQHADDLRSALRREIVRAMAEGLGNEVAPSGPMEERRLWRGVDECIP